MSGAHAEAAPPPSLADIGAHVTKSRPECVLVWNVTEPAGELVLDVTPNGIHSLVEFLKSDPMCQFTTLVDITAVDRPERVKRFDVVYHFLSMRQNRRVRLRARHREDEMLASITGIHPSAGWFEREIFDMFGIVFSGHPDLRRILTDYGFRGHPLRKDFPTTGFVEMRYDEESKRCIYEPVSLVQEYRQFDFMSPWEGASRLFDSTDADGTPGRGSRAGSSVFPAGGVADANSASDPDTDGKDDEAAVAAVGGTNGAGDDAPAGGKAAT